MYGDFAQAMVTNMTQRMDPMNRVIGTLMEGQAKQQEQELILSANKTVEVIQQSLAKAQAADPVNIPVVEAYERLLARATAAAS